MSAFKFFVAPDPLFIDPITGTFKKYTIWDKQPNKVYPTIAVFKGFMDAFDFIQELSRK